MTRSTSRPSPGFPGFLLCGLLLAASPLAAEPADDLAQLLDRAARLEAARVGGDPARLLAERNRIADLSPEEIRIRSATVQALYGLGSLPQLMGAYDCGGTSVTALGVTTDVGGAVVLLSNGQRTVLLQEGETLWKASSVTAEIDAQSARTNWLTGSLETCPAIPPSEALQLHRATRDTACFLVETNFVDPGFRGIDLPTACAGRETPTDIDTARNALSALIARLRTSHTAYFPPGHPSVAILSSVFGQADPMAAEIRRRGETALLIGSGYFTVGVGGKTFVDQVLDGSPAARAGLRSGDEIVDANGTAFATRWVPTGTTVSPTIRDATIRRKADGPTERLSLTVTADDALTILGTATRESVRVMERDGKRIGYLHGWTMLTRDATGGPAREMAAAIADGVFDGVDAVVLDARGQIGGGGLDILTEFLAPRVAISGKGREDPAWSQSGNPMPPQTPLVVLIDAHTRSSAEIMAEVVRAQRLGVLVGETTAGAVTGGTLFPLPDGGVLYVAVYDLRVGGRQLEGVGVAPDVTVARPVPFSAGADPQLDRALIEAARLAAKAD